MEVKELEAIAITFMRDKLTPIHEYELISLLNRHRCSILDRLPGHLRILELKLLISLRIYRWLELLRYALYWRKVGREPPP